MIGIYSITNSGNGKRYIGQSIDIEKRWREHRWYLRANKHKNNHLQNAWNKYGETAFVFEVLEECEFSVINDKEVFWINHFDSTNNGYNLDSGGNNGKRHSEETKRKMSEAAKGEKNHNYGKTFDEAYRAKLSESNARHFKGKTHSGEARKAMSESKKGKTVSWNKKAVMCLETKSVFDSAQDANKLFSDNLSTNISDCCRGRQDTAYGFHWVFLDDELRAEADRKREARNSKKKKKPIPVLCVETGESFPSINAAHLAYPNLSKESITNACKNENILAGDFHWKLVNERDLTLLSSSQSEDPFNHNYPNGPVVCMETGGIFATAKEACNQFGGKKNPSNVILCCSGKRNTAYGFHWEYLEEENRNKADKYKENKRNTQKNAPKRSVRCIETQIEYPSARSAAIAVNGTKDGTSIIMCCERKRETAYGTHWEFVNQAERERYSENAPKQTKKRRILCVETGAVYDTLKEASLDIAKTKNGGTNIGRCCRDNERTAYGYHFKYVE